MIRQYQMNQQRGHGTCGVDGRAWARAAALATIAADTSGAHLGATLSLAGAAQGLCSVLGVGLEFDAPPQTPSKQNQDRTAARIIFGIGRYILRGV